MENKSYQLRYLPMFESLTKIGLAAPVSTMVGIVLNVGFYIYLGKQEKKISKK